MLFRSKTRLHPENERAFGPAVCEMPAPRTQEKGGQNLSGRDERRPFRFLRDLIRQPGKRRVLHPRPHQRDELAEKIESIVAMAERTKGRKHDGHYKVVSGEW